MAVTVPAHPLQAPGQRPGKPPAPAAQRRARLYRRGTPRSPGPNPALPAAGGSSWQSPPPVPAPSLAARAVGLDCLGPDSVLTARTYATSRDHEPCISVQIPRTQPANRSSQRYDRADPSTVIPDFYQISVHRLVI